MRTRASSCIAVCLALFLSNATHADPFDHWIPITTGLPTNLTSIAYGIARYVAVGYATPEAGWILSSPDRVNWTPATCQDRLCAPPALYTVTFANNRFLAAGKNSWIYTSTNGLDWHVETFGTSETLLLDAAYGGGTYASVGDSEACPCGYVGLSQNATNWTALEISDVRRLGGITYGQGKFVTVGFSDDGMAPTRRNIFTSTNSFATWNSISVAQTNKLFGVAYGNGVFVAAGEEHHTAVARILTSTDGENWNTPTLPTTNSLRNVSFVEGIFLATGNSGTLLTSTNGIDWLLRPAFTNNLLGRSILGTSQIVMLADAGLFASDPLISLQIAFGTQPQLTVSGLEGRSYRIEATQDVGSSAWQNMGTYFLYTSPTIWADGTPLPKARFYRAILLP